MNKLASLRNASTFCVIHLNRDEYYLTREGIVQSNNEFQNPEQ